uniref:Sushi domain-containing protein n=1 Tax=Hippocampus comes TaxID=109280 RepID=A0A3Q3D7W9_HIPCM
TNVTTMFCDCAKTLNFGGCQTDSYISCAIIRPPRDGGIRYRGLTQDVQILPVDYEIEYICRGNRVIVGPKVRKCLPNGTWTDMTQHSSCREYSSLYLYSGMGMRRLPPGPPVEGSVLHYRCHSGFILEGRNVSHCTKLGKWDAPKPICRQEPVTGINLSPAEVAGSGWRWRARGWEVAERYKDGCLQFAEIDFSHL